MRVSMMKSISISLIIGMLWGSLTGLVEALILLQTGMNPYLTTYVILDSTICYSVVWGVTGIIIGIVLFFLPGIKIENRAGLLQHLFFFLFSILYVLGYYINLFFLPQFFATVSLVFDTVLTISMIILGILLYRILSRATSRGETGSLWILRNSTAFTGWIITLILSFALTIWLPSGIQGTRSVEQDFGITGPSEPTYNVLIISIDTLRKDHMSFYGYHRDTTPNVNRHFRDSVWFTNAFSQSSHTKPSTASLLTSLYVSAHNMSRLNAGLPENATTATEIFKSIGYTTSIFAANNFISPFFGFDQGVDFFFGHHPREITASGLYNALFAFKMSRVPLLTSVGDVSIRLIELINLKPYIWTEKILDVSDETITQVLMEWIEEHKEERFFSYVHYIAPHDPYEPPPPFDQLYVPYPDAGHLTRFEYSGFLPFKTGDPVGEKELANTIGQYDGEINYIDTHIGQILECLQDLGLDQQTLIVLTADHGEEFYEHTGWAHGHSLYNELTNIPLIIRMPSLITREGNLDARVQQVDLIPSILDLLGYSVPPELQGKSFANLLTDSLAESYGNHIIFMEIDWGGHGAKSIIRDNYKLIESHYGVEKSKMLYNLAIDQNETNDLSQIEMEIVKEWERDINEILKDISRSKLESQDLMLNEEVKDELRALGYIK